MVHSNSKTVNETRGEMPEKKTLARCIQSSVRRWFGLYNTYMCDYEKKDAEIFFRTRTHQFDEICEYADIDPDRAWKLIQKTQNLYRKE